MSIIKELGKIGIGATVTHKYGDDVYSITKEDDAVYRMDGETYTLVDLSLKFGEKLVERKVYFLKKPYATHCHSSHVVNSKGDYAKLLEQARKDGEHLYFATVAGPRQIRYPLILDWDSVKDVIPEKTTTATAKAVDAKPKLVGCDCPFCHKSISSTPGRTLHVKSAHPERLEEYQELLAEVNAPPPPPLQPAEAGFVYGTKSVPIEDNEEDVVTLLEQSSTESGIPCPYCRKRLSSTSGRTLHVKNAHPEQYLQYLKDPNG